MLEEEVEDGHLVAIEGELERDGGGKGVAVVDRGASFAEKADYVYVGGGDGEFERSLGCGSDVGGVGTGFEEESYVGEAPC